MEQRRADERTNEIGFEGSIVSAAWNVREGGDKFGRTVIRSMREEEVSQVIVTTGFEVRGVMNRRGRGHQQLNCIRGTP
jgi:hypothetical protein